MIATRPELCTGEGSGMCPRGPGDRSERKMDCWCPVLSVWVESTVSLSTLTPEANRDAQAGAAHDPGEMCPWICMVVLLMSDVWGPSQDSNKQPTGRASKANLSLTSPSHHSQSLYSFSHAFPSLSTLAAILLHICCHAPSLCFLLLPPFPFISPFFLPSSPPRPLLLQCVPTQ